MVHYDCAGIYRDEDETKSCFKSAQNRVCCSMGYGYTYIGTPNFCVKVLWVCELIEVRIFCPTKIDSIQQKAFRMAVNNLNRLEFLEDVESSSEGRR